MLKDAKGQVLPSEPLPGLPILLLRLLVSPSTQVGDGTIEEVSLTYVPMEADRIKDALVKKFGPSHPHELVTRDIEIAKLIGAKLISRDTWEPGWGELSLVVADKYVLVHAKTSKLIAFERENKKDEF